MPNILFLDGNSDVIVTHVMVPSTVLAKKARAYFLPAQFYNHLNKDDNIEYVFIDEEQGKEENKKLTISY